MRSNNWSYCIKKVHKICSLKVQRLQCNEGTAFVFLAVRYMLSSVRLSVVCNFRVPYSGD